MRLAEQWREIQSRLVDGWAGATLRLTIPDEADSERAAALLGPLNPGRSGKVLRFASARGGLGAGPELVTRLLRRLDDHGIEGGLELLAAEQPTEASRPARPSLVALWESELAALPPDWSDVWAEVDLDSSDYLEPGAIELAPLNPLRFGDGPVFRFRVAHRFGYGASPGMARRCLERCDEAGFTGGVRILRALSDTQPAYTQGPVWSVAGRTV